MNTTVQEKVKVVTIYDPYDNFNRPYLIKWKNRVYKVTKVGFHHKKKTGRTLEHIYSLISETTFFKLRFDTDTLDWYLEEIYDGTTH